MDEELPRRRRAGLFGLVYILKLVEGQMPRASARVQYVYECLDYSRSIAFHAQSTPPYYRNFRPRPYASKISIAIWIYYKRACNSTNEIGPRKDSLVPYRELSDELAPDNLDQRR